jgi:hypothetical protein
MWVTLTHGNSILTFHWTCFSLLEQYIKFEFRTSCFKFICYLTIWLHNDTSSIHSKATPSTCPRYYPAIKSFARSRDQTRLLDWIRSKLANKPRHNRTANWMLHQWCRYAAWMNHTMAQNTQGCSLQHILLGETSLTSTVKYNALTGCTSTLPVKYD